MKYLFAFLLLLITTPTEAIELPRIIETPKVTRLSEGVTVDLSHTYKKGDSIEVELGWTGAGFRVKQNKIQMSTFALYFDSENTGVLTPLRFSTWKYFKHRKTKKMSTREYIYTNYGKISLSNGEFSEIKLSSEKELLNFKGIGVDKHQFVIDSQTNRFNLTEKKKQSKVLWDWWLNENLDCLIARTFLSIPRPEKPVKQGGKWRVDSGFKKGSPFQYWRGADTKLTMTFELLGKSKVYEKECYIVDLSTKYEEVNADIDISKIRWLKYLGWIAIDVKNNNIVRIECKYNHSQGKDLIEGGSVFVRPKQSNNYYENNTKDKAVLDAKQNEFQKK
jgi:hypothetical protein